MISININSLVIKNEYTLEMLVAQMQMYTEKILYVFNNEKMFIFEEQDRPDYILFDQNVKSEFGYDIYYFEDKYTNRYSFFGENNAMIFFGKSLVSTTSVINTVEPKKKLPGIYSVEISPTTTEEGDIKGEPILDLIQEIIDKGQTMEIIDINTNLDSKSLDEVKIVRIISMDKKNVIEINVPDKPLYEIMRHKII